MVAAFFEKCQTCGTDKGGLLEQFEKAALRSLEKADIIPIHMEHEQGELESEEQNTRDVRMEQFKAIIGSR